MLYNQDKIKRFASDVEMNETVKRFVIDKVLQSSKSEDTNYLAAKMIAVDLIQDAWKDLNKSRPKEQLVEPDLKQIGL